MQPIEPARAGDEPLVDFLICGTQKGGTSALDAYLRRHPAIAMAERKEVHFFDNEGFFEGQAPDYGAYHAAFRPRPGQVVGEATPIYMYWQEAPRRIWEYNPRMKLIVLLRNPIERAYSHWNMERLRGAESLPFGEAIRRERQRCRQALPWQHRVYSYVDRGFYLEQLRRLWRFFPTEQVLVLEHQQLKQRPEVCLNQVCRFLGVAPFDSVVPLQAHALPYPQPMAAADRAYLRELFEYEIMALERALGWDCRDWLIP